MGNSTKIRTLAEVIDEINPYLLGEKHWLEDYKHDLTEAHFSLSSYLRERDLVKRAGYLIRCGIIEFDFGNKRFAQRRQPAGQREFLAKQERFNLWDRSGKHCDRCQSNKNLMVDHIIPFTAWPDSYAWLADDSSNLRMLCGDCNKAKSNHFEYARARNTFADCCWGCDTTDRDYSADATYLAFCTKCGVDGYAFPDAMPLFRGVAK